MKSNNQEIVDATIKWIDAYGYTNFSLRKLANELNLTAAAIYKHFKNKDSLFRAATRQLSAKFIDNLELNSNQTSEEQLLSLAQQFCQQFEKHTNLMEFLFFNSQAVIALDQDDENEYPFLEKTRELVHKVNQGKISDETLLIKLWSFIQGYALLIKNHITKYDPEVVSSSLKQLLGEEK